MADTDLKRAHGNETVSHGRRRVILGAEGMAAASLASFLPALPALAHHGWPGFNTDHFIYIAGTVSSNGTWGNPHSLFDVTLDGNLPVRTPKLAIPEQLQDLEDSIRVNAARRSSAHRRPGRAGGAWAVR